MGCDTAQDKPCIPWDGFASWISRRQRRQGKPRAMSLFGKYLENIDDTFLGKILFFFKIAPGYISITFFSWKLWTFLERSVISPKFLCKHLDEISPGIMSTRHSQSHCTPPLCCVVEKTVSEGVYRERNQPKLVWRAGGSKDVRTHVCQSTEKYTVKGE